MEPKRAGKPCLGRTPEQYCALLEVAESIASHRELRDLFRDLAQRLHSVVAFDFLALILHDGQRNAMRLHILEAVAPAQVDSVPSLELPVGESPGGLVWETQQPVILHEAELQQRFPRVHALTQAHGVQSLCMLPLTTARRRVGALGLGSREASVYGKPDLDFMSHVARQVAVAVENALAFQEIAELKDKLAEEKLYLEDEIRTEYNFDEIVGTSAPVKRTLRQVETVAPTDSTVLILGETGTGKELVARALHHLSARRERTFVKLNCAAIPTGLLESELFGHERGAFTGAITQKIGRLELADGGTLFLDEIGDIPLELQPKLLRVLQEKEFERLGSVRTIRVDVRLVAATNRDLVRMVSEGLFRSDLYYRLNVFPIVVPPLRDRPEDIPLLVRYFAQKYSRRMTKRIETIHAEAMEELVRYSWPGNIRELENFVERAVILSKDSMLALPLSELRLPAENGGAMTTLEAAERDHILRALRETRWVVGGPRGAAARLGINRTTLQSRMRKLGISRPEIAM